MATTAYEDIGKVIDIPAGADLSAKQYYAIEADGTLPTAAGVYCVGILQNKPDASGKPASIMISGISKAIANGTTDIAIGDMLSTNASGVLVKATVRTQSGTTPFAVTSGHKIVAMALQALTDDADRYIAVLVMPGQEAI